MPSAAGCTLLETRAYVLGPDGEEVEIELPDITAFLPQHLRDKVTETRCVLPGLDLNNAPPYCTALAAVS